MSCSFAALSQGTVIPEIPVRGSSLPFAKMDINVASLDPATASAVRKPAAYSRRALCALTLGMSISTTSSGLVPAVTLTYRRHSQEVAVVCNDALTPIQGVKHSNPNRRQQADFKAALEQGLQYVNDGASKCFSQLSSDRYFSILCQVRFATIDYGKKTSDGLCDRRAGAGT